MAGISFAIEIQRKALRLVVVSPLFLVPSYVHNCFKQLLFIDFQFTQGREVCNRSSFLVGVLVQDMMTLDLGLILLQ